MNKYICVKRRREKEDETKVYKWTACRYDGGFTACRIAGTGEGVGRNSFRYGKCKF